MRAALAEYRGVFAPLHNHHYGIDEGRIDGKLLRPVLVMMACEMAGGDAERALPIALAVEMIHNFSLVHDDIEDNDLIRHHRPTVWAHWGKRKTVFSGNAMLKLADLTVAPMLEGGIRHDTVMAIHRRLAEVCLRMIEGQHLDILYEGAPGIGEEQYYAMVDRKTGNLIAAALECGAASSSGLPESAARLHEVGLRLGRLFQARDDMLGAWGDGTSGKPVGGDIRKRKNALPLVHLLNHAPKRLREAAKHELQAGPPDQRATNSILSLMEQAGTREWCQSECTSHHRQLQAAITALPTTQPAKQELQHLGDYLLTRHH